MYEQNVINENKVCIFSFDKEVVYHVIQGNQ